MIDHCPVCGSEDLDLDRGVCRNCGSALEAATRQTDEIPRADGPTPSPPAPVKPPVPVKPPAPAPPLPSVPAAPPSTAARLAHAADEGDWQSWEDMVFRAYAEGFRIITLIGFSEAGKTFFANRLRRELRLARGWTVAPGESRNIKKSDARIDWTEIIKHGGRPRRYLLADVDGEAYHGSVVRLLDKERAGSAWRRYVLLSALASAYVLMIPARSDFEQADEVGTERLVDRFDVIVGVTLALQKRLRDMRDLRRAVQEPVTEADCRLVLRESYRCPQPLQVLFAQADKFADVQAHEGDPYAFAARRARALHQTVSKHFAVHRFDFVSAFAGHVHHDDYRVDYRCPHYGTLEAWSWIDRMTAPPRGLRLFRRHTTRAAKAVRWLLDGSYRRLAAESR